MLEDLKNYCQSVLPFSPEELAHIDQYFKVKIFNKKDYLLTAGAPCQFLGFITKGAVRHFHIKDGNEKTCDLSFEQAWVTDFKSFNEGTISQMHLQAMAETTVCLIQKKDLMHLYASHQNFERFGRIMAEQVAQRATDIAMSLSSEKPEERVSNLMYTQPDLFQKIPQKYIANFLGINPESLSRIRKRIILKTKS